MKELWRMIVPRDDVASCMQVLRRLDAYLDGQLEDRTMARRIAAHLDVCERCGMKAETITALKSALRRLGPRSDPRAVARLRAFARSLP